MSNFLLFWKRTRVFIKYRFLIYKFHFLKFWGKFIPYFKPMTKRTTKEILECLDKYFIEYLTAYYNDKTKFEINSKYIEKHLNTSICELHYIIKLQFSNLQEVEFEIIFEHHDIDTLIPNIRQLTFENKNNKKFLEKIRDSFSENFNKNHFISHTLGILKTKDINKDGSITVFE